ncbi:MAG: carbohydrate ABC transporter permease [Christensenellales bacterium]|jgi:ABC-type sugar transport system permease subunit
MTISKKVTRNKKAVWGYFFLTPWLVLFGIFYAYPLFYGVFVSFTDYSLSGMNWIGGANYTGIFNDYAFWRSLLAMLKYAVIIIPLRTFIPLWIANTLRPHKPWFNSLTKLLMYIPSVTCATALVITWKFLLAPGTGLVSELMRVLGFGNASLMDNANTSIPILSLLIVFNNIGANVIVYSAALNGVPNTYYEAAEIDGANHIKKLFNITIPLLKPTIVYVLITSTIATLQLFVVPQLMTGGGPNFTSSTLLMLIYNSAFINYKLGYASAIGVVLFILTGIVALIQFRATRHENIEY